MDVDQSESSDSDSDYIPEDVTKTRARKKSKANGIKKPKRKVRSNQCAPSMSLPIELPVGLLVMIFQYIVGQFGPFLALKKYGLVSKKWRLALLENTLWHSVCLNGKESWLNINQALKWLCKFKYCTVKTLIILSWRPGYNSRNFGQLLQICPQVKCVEFNNCGFLKFDEVFKCLDQIEKLIIVQCNVKSFNVLVQTCKMTLRYLSLTDVGSSLCLSLTKCDTPLVQLTTLQLDNFCHFRADSIDVIQKMCPNLIHLQLCFNCNAVSKDLHSEMNVNGFLHLKYLELTFQKYNSMYESDVLCLLLAASPNLRYLSLIYFTCAVDYDKLVSIMSRSLTELALFYCKFDFNELLSKLLLRCDILQRLTIASPKDQRVNDDIITTIITSPCTNTLQYLDLSGTDVTINGIRLLLSCACNLKHLDLLRCRYLPRGTKRVYSNAVDLDELIKVQ